MKTVCTLALAVICVAIPAGATTYFLDCGGGNDGSSGRSENSAWRSLGRVNGQQFQPGDAILLRRGAECSGMLWPKGSGLAGKPIVAGAYGNGPLPIVRAEDDPASLKLFNQQYWHIENLELVGGNPYGI
ncbi:MAG: hypothetical protein GY953_57425, partial [bacterium]|nr:hypothetical protein [bacterium]